LAAAHLIDQPAPAPVTEPTTIEFTCPQCDEKITVSSELAGKRTPCPECKRIIKVPEPKDDKPKDWREIDTRRPSAARPEAGSVPTGTWGTREGGLVSAEALIEADAVPRLQRRITWQQWARRGTLLGACLVGVLIALWFASRSVDQYRKSHTLARALEALNSKGVLTPETAAELHRAAGVHYLAAGDAEKARNHFQEARAAVPAKEATSLSERDLLLVDLLLSQVELGGDKVDIGKGARLKWETALHEIRQTWQNLGATEARIIALRALTRRLLEKGQEPPVRFASQFTEDAPQLLAVVAMECVQSNKQLAESLAKQAVALVPKPTPKPGEEGTKRPPPAPVTALLVALRKNAEAIAPLPEVDIPETATLLGYVEGWARRGELGEARKRARDAHFAVDRLQALVVVAEVALGGKQTDAARSDLDICLKLANGELKGKQMSSWLLYRLVQLCAQCGIGDSAVAVASNIADAGLRGRAQLEIFRARLARSGSSVDDSVADIVDKSSPAHGLALEDLARHKTEIASFAAAKKIVDSWDPPKERPLGEIGIALGLQGSATN
jgi:hypothetical protein